ncbi:golgin subfamily A member 4-like, partial [Limulus polyphemus]|uniref:Golgin subfamily A member 4-like n=1 Tax=Limulus polyphemus TaxID=6850 RepID=A0ABM1RUB5_LIMPO
MFPKAKNKRFNEECGCAPPVGYYNPNDKHKIRGVALEKTERPVCMLPCDGLNPDMSVSSSSSHSNGSVRSTKLQPTPFKTPFQIKSCISSTPRLNKLARDRFYSEPNEGSQVEQKLLESISSLEKEKNDYLLELDSYKTKVLELETELSIRGREVTEKGLLVSDYQGKLEETDQKVQEMETEVTDLRNELSEKELLITDFLKLKATLLTGVEGCAEKLGILESDIQELNELVTHTNHYSFVENVGIYSTNELENSTSKVLNIEPYKTKKFWEEVIQKLSSEEVLEIERSEKCKNVPTKEGLEVPEIQKLMINPVQKMLSLEKGMRKLHLSIVKYLDLKNSEVCAVKAENSSLKQELTEVTNQLSTYRSLIEESNKSSQETVVKDLENRKVLNVQENSEHEINQLKLLLDEKDTRLEASRSKLSEFESSVRTLEALLDEKDTCLEASKSKLSELESSVRTLEALLDEKDTCLVAAKSKLSELESSVRTLEELCRKSDDEKCQIKNLKTERCILESQLKEIQETVVILETTAQEKDDYLNQKTSEMIELKKEKSDLEKQLEAVETETKHLQTMLEENVIMIAERDLEISRLQNETKCLTEQTKSTENKMNDVLLCLEDKEISIKNLNVELLQEQETKLRLQRQLECVKEEQKNQKYLIDGKDESIQNLNSKILSICDEKEQLSSQLTSLEIEKNNAYISLQEKDSSISLLISENKILEGKLEKLEKENKELVNSLHQNNISVSVVESEKNCLQENLQHAEKEICEVKLQNKEILAQKSNEISKLETDKIAVEKALKMINEQFHNLQLELEKLNDLIAIKNSKLSCIETEKSNLQSQLTCYEEKFKSQDNILNEKEENLSAKNAEIETLNNKLEILVQETESCKLENRRTIEELDRLQEKTKISDRLIQELTEQKNNAEDQITKLSNEVNRFQERIVELIFENEAEQAKADQRFVHIVTGSSQGSSQNYMDLQKVLVQVRAIWTCRKYWFKSELYGLTESTGSSQSYMDLQKVAIWTCREYWFKSELYGPAESTGSSQSYMDLQK